ncbi:hypothetical protein BDM02DRAFT_618901 [Thelephora ganbajun]|uniref:Uncharacterized protein n=1 Tax=Thelephora ganbajun TaxID=370292 RepID=A0ACB6ZQK2_THEGA|nr:hypothetical protein BDM02DRAFT_618901 [Thelephora ganbajun]
MGQTTSKQKTSKASNSPSSTGSSTQYPTASTTSLGEDAVASSERPKRSRRSTIRRSIIGLVGKSKDSSGTTHSTTARSDAAPSSRKSWRRISRALSLGATEGGHTALAPVTPSKGKGKERAIEEEDHEQPKPSTSQRPESPVLIRRQSSTSILTNPVETEDALPELSVEPDVESPPPSLEPIDSPPAITPTPTHADPPQDPTPPLRPQLDQSQPGPRHFPPPGTLVVVQGVVNTIDTGSTPNNSNSNNLQTSNTVFPTTASRPNSGLFSGSTRSRPSTPTGEHSAIRNNRRLSSIIRRPASLFNDSRRNTIIEGEGAADASPLGPTADSTIGTSSDTPSDSTNPTTPSDSDPDSQSTQQRPLSPGSIDVLGTLLSVAAAATAASLFSPTSFAGRTELPPEPNVPRPTSPTPTAGLGVNGFGPLDTLAELGFPMDRDQGLGTGAGNTPSTNGHNLSRERLRGAWDNLRERLGLRDGRNNPENITPELFGEARDGSRTGAGEAMITEMARALGTGLGLQEEGPGRPTDGPTVTTSNAMADVSSVPPPEGTFERFLYNLQADLRIVLSEDVPMDQSTNTNGPADPGDDEVSPTPVQLESDMDIPQAAAPDHGDDRPSTEPSHRTEMDDFVEVPRSTTPATSLPPTQSPPIMERRPTSGINLWRSYRFPPIIAPPRQNPLVSGADQTIVAPSSLLPTIPLTLPGESTRSGHPQRPDTPVPSSIIPPQSTPSAQADVVVPVIIVGLQSVNVDPQRPEQSEEGDGLFARPDHRGDGSVLPPEAWGHGEDGGQTMRGRPWHTRAADALRNLRPGRRSGSSTMNANDRVASRTFLIYVIGGYYPPNHHIVTGTDGMDSYDALWELAALIGQVKPPTATPEDIEKSGLQIIKSTDIPQYAAEGRVAPNCIDRCLICLDDYEPEEDLRVMSCKHFFHQNCVDKWLQVGRNNCPACRMKGVSTTVDQDSNSTPVPPTIPAP